MKYTVEGRKLVMEVEKADVEAVRELATMPYGPEYTDARRKALKRIGDRSEYDRLVVFLCDHWLNIKEGE